MCFWDLRVMAADWLLNQQLRPTGTAGTKIRPVQILVPAREPINTETESLNPEKERSGTKRRKVGWWARPEEFCHSPCFVCAPELHVFSPRQNVPIFHGPPLSPLQAYFTPAYTIGTQPPGFGKTDARLLARQPQVRVITIEASTLRNVQYQYGLCEGAHDNLINDADRDTFLQRCFMWVPGYWLVPAGSCMLLLLSNFMEHTACTAVQYCCPRSNSISHWICVVDNSTTPWLSPTA